MKVPEAWRSGPWRLRFGLTTRLSDAAVHLLRQLEAIESQNQVGYPMWDEGLIELLKKLTKIQND